MLSCFCFQVYSESFVVYGKHHAPILHISSSAGKNRDLLDVNALMLEIEIPVGNHSALLAL